MGGIGAKSEKDYEKLIAFIEAPWKSRMADNAMEEKKGLFFPVPSMASCADPVELERRTMEDSTPKPSRKSTSISLNDFGASRSSSASIPKSCPASFAP